MTSLAVRKIDNAYTNGYSEPLIDIKLHVEGLILENIQRPADDTTSVATLAVRNGGDNVIEFDTASKSQIQQISESADSVDVRVREYATPDGVVRYHVATEMKGDGEFLIPGGSINRLVLNG